VTKCYQNSQLVFSFARCQRRRVEASFSGGHVTSDGGVLLLRQADRKLGLLREVSQALEDPRRKKSCAHALLTMLRQRVFGLCLGYEDLNDHHALRHDLALQTGVDRAGALASAPTLCRLENRADRAAAWAVNRALVEQFIASHKRPPKEIVLDFDATDDRVHGLQEGRFFHGYYDHYCFLPLYVFCGEQLLVAYLRPSNIDPAQHAGALLKLLVRRLRQAWPQTRIVFRADSGFCRHWILGWCERNNIGYAVGMARNPRLLALAAPLMETAAEAFAQEQRKQRLFASLRYAAHTWKRQRRVIVKAEHTSKGPNPRFVVTNLPQSSQHVYDTIYCARGEMENRIKEQQLDLFADRTSCHRWWANQWRLLLSALAYTLMEAIRRLALQGTELARAQCGTLRLKLLKIGAVIVRNTRRIRVLLSSAYPYQTLFLHAAAKLNTS